MPRRRRSGAIPIAFLMLLNAGGVDGPHERRPVRADAYRLPRGLAHRPALPGRDGVRQPDVRRGGRVDHDGARRAAGRPRHAPAGTSSSARLIRRRPAQRRRPSDSLLFFLRGGSGAIKGTDGYDALGFTGTPGSMRSQDMEIFELSTPHLVEYLELDPDSAGAGEWRGGYGTRTRFRFLGEGVRGSTLGDDSAAEGAARPRACSAARRRAEHAAADAARRHRARLGLQGGVLASRRARSATRSTAAAPATATRGGATRELVVGEVREGLLTPGRRARGLRRRRGRRRIGDRRGRDGAGLRGGSAR